jgi:Pentapeptide repeats (8 copies)
MRIFRRANLAKAEFRGADLIDADLRFADLTGAAIENVYVCTVLLGIPVGQLALIKCWMNRKRQELASVDEQIEKIR